MGIKMLKKLAISDKDLLALLPTFTQRQAKFDYLWQDYLSNSGLITVCNEFKYGELTHRTEIGNLIELPPFMRLGRLSVEKSHRTKEFLEVQNYLELSEVTALLHFRDKSAVISHSEIDPRRMARMLQKQLIQLLCNLEPTVVTCTGIDLQNYGANYALLMAAVPKFKTITDSRELQEFFRQIPEILKERNKTKGYAHEYLYDYNRTHKDSTVPYHFVFISSYEQDLGDEEKTVIERLLNHDNSAKAGVYFFINFIRKGKFKEFVNKYPDLPQVAEFGDEPNSVRLEVSDRTGLDTTVGGIHSILEVAQDKEDLRGITELTDFCRKHLKTLRPDPVLLSLPQETDWSEKGWHQTSEFGIQVPIGKSKGHEVNFELGGESGIIHNALVGGAVGTGKTNLLHSIIVQVLARYSPEEVKLSVLDYKSGTEFRAYKSVPHLYAISLGSGTKFGVDLLAHFQTELERRADLFKESGVSNISAYRKKTGIKMPRHLVIIDEFQLLFTNSEAAKTSLEDLIRRGRSFGFNFILSSQSLKDASLTSPTKANIGARVCLRLSEADCSDFLSIENTLPSRFTYPGQAVYNDQEGRTEANVEFRVAYYADEVLSNFFELLQRTATAANLKLPDPYIYTEDSVLQKSQLNIDRPSHTLFLGYQEGIPRVMRYISLAPESGPVLIMGIGPMREAFDAHFEDELKTLHTQDFLDLESEAIEPYLDKVESFETTPPPILILRIKAKEANSPLVQNAVGNLVSQAKTKLILVMDGKSTLRTFFNLDERSAALVLYLDQKSIDGYGNELKGQIGSIAAILPDESELSIIKIPVLVKE